MAHRRGLGVAVALICLLAGVVFAAGDTISTLENKITKLESALREEPAELRPMLQRELNSARRELRQALQDRFDLLSRIAASNADEEKAKTERLAKLRARIDELNQQLAGAATSTNPPPAQPTTAPPGAAAAPPTSEHAPALEPSSAPSQPLANNGSAPAAAATDPLAPANAKPQEAAAIPEPEFAEEAALPKTVNLRVDISREWNDPDTDNKCSNRPFSQSAKVWKLVVVADPQWQDPKKKLAHYFVDAKNNLLIPVATLKQNPSVAMVVGARTYLGHAERRVREVRLVFENLSLAEVSDLADHLANHAEEIAKAYRESIAKYEVFQVAFSHSPQKTVAPVEFYDVLKCNLDPVKQPDAFHDLLLRAAEGDGLEMETCEWRSDPEKPRPKGTPVRVKAKSPYDLTARIESARLDSSSIKETKRMVGVLINSQADSWSSEAAARKAKPATTSAGATAAEPVAGQAEEAPPALEIEEPCFNLSIAPLLSGNEFKPVAKFRFRYDYYTADDKISLKIRAEGEGAQGGQYFQRVKVGGEATGLFGPAKKGWQMAGGAVGHYSFTRDNGMQIDEWQAGGKFQIQAPYIRLFDTRAGADSRPMVIVEGGAAGGNGSTTGNTDFSLTFGTRYTLRPNPRVSLDLKADGGWSNHARFATEKTFSYVSVQGRFNLESSWDYVVRYECGRKDPDYRKFCGWQTGLVLVTGR